MSKNKYQRTKSKMNKKYPYAKFFENPVVEVHWPTKAERIAYMKANEKTRKEIEYEDRYSIEMQKSNERDYLRNKCGEHNYVTSYIKEDGTMVLGHCRKRAR